MTTTTSPRLRSIPLILVSLLSLTFLLSLTPGCSKQQKPDASQPQEQPASRPSPGATPSSAAPASDPSESLTVTTADNSNVVTVTLGNVVKIAPEGGALLQGELRDNGKRKYTEAGGKVVVEVKSDADAFKVRTPDGRLLWKVKLTDDKIKVSDNEENRNPYELKMKEDKVKVEENEQSLGEVKYYADKIKVKDASDKDMFETRSTRRSAAYGVLLMSRISESERYIIMAELLSRGR
jgi:hypothetical protein